MRRPHTSRQLQVFRCLERNYALSVKQLARRLKLSVRSIRRYLPILLEHNIIYVRYTHALRNSKKPTNFYSIVRDADNNRL